MVQDFVVCSIKDRALNSFSVPFFVPDLREAQRRFDLFACDLNKKVYISNFELYHLGRFNCSDGSFSLSEPAFLQSNDDLFYSRFEAQEVK